MSLRRSLLFTLALAPFTLLLTPLLAHATGIPFFGPIVPEVAARCAAGWGALADLLNRVLAFSITIAILFVAPLSIAWGGFLYVVNPVNPAGRSKANKILLNTIVGIVIALSAWLIVNALLTAFTFLPGGGTGGVQGFTAQMFNGGDTCLPIATQLNQAEGQTEGVGTPYVYSVGGQEYTTHVATPTEACANHGGLPPTPSPSDDTIDPVDNGGGDGVLCKDGTAVPLTTTSANPNQNGVVAYNPTGSSCLSARSGINLNESADITHLSTVLNQACSSLPAGSRIVVTTTTNHGTVSGGGTSQHQLERAMDIQIIDANGAVVQNRGADSSGLYTQLAIAAYKANQGSGCNMAWGGCFDTGANTGVADLMHFDCGGDRGRRCNLSTLAR